MRKVRRKNVNTPSLHEWSRRGYNNTRINKWPFNTSRTNSNRYNDDEIVAWERERIISKRVDRGIDNSHKMVIVHISRVITGWRVISSYQDDSWYKGWKFTLVHLHLYLIYSVKVMLIIANHSHQLFLLERDWVSPTFSPLSLSHEIANNSYSCSY